MAESPVSHRLALMLSSINDAIADAFASIVAAV